MDLLKKLRKVKTDRAESDAEQYRRLIASADPDPAALADVAARLGLTDENVAYDAEAIKKVGELEAVAAGIDLAAEQATRDAEVAMLTAEARQMVLAIIGTFDVGALRRLAGELLACDRADATARGLIPIREKLDAIEAANTRLRAASNRVMAARQEIADVRRGHALAFGQSAPVPPKLVVSAGGVQ